MHSFFWVGCLKFSFILKRHKSFLFCQFTSMALKLCRVHSTYHTNIRTGTPTGTTQTGKGHMATSSDRDMESSLPLVLACGYRQVYIAKSGLSFPAWLVKIPEENGSVCLVWKSKRDFWRLARHVTSFPKAAWKKLAQSAPWQRPDFARHAPIDSTNGTTKFWDEDAENNWQPKMKRSLFLLDQYLQMAASITTPSEARDAWLEFVLDTSEVASLANTDGRHNNDSQRGNALGQYFCHPSNALQLVQTALSRLRSLCDNQHSSLLAIEPSCGYGQIIETLLQELPTQFPSTDEKINFRIRGIDLDTVAIDRCRSNLTQHNFVDLVATDFLSTSLSDISGWQENSAVFVVGGPPYTAGAGKGRCTSTPDESLLHRNLPMKFVQHAVSAYSALVVCFLMPMRCQRVDYHKEGWLPSNYDYESIELEAPSVFFFQGREPVKQPSLIQCFWRASF